ncbi:serine/threonine-protein phosphatase 7 long form-like [Heracleum sosnowskyi]|uniref:Serine/threonine-protein phosphatase 7 long form-like n=1 Tax=Heracleum sosnowskyi TaxID=360622 RepID=A0AAD8IM33_9APIA|nr:serine/threonine-protein phosphatase 7 long form-like [Heracleum sosnowskyi]
MDDCDVADIELNPGTKDPLVLYLQVENRSTNIWKVGGGDNQRSRVRNKYTPVHPKMVPYLRDIHFDGVARLTGIHIDWSLATALVERWRPETHTFHLPTGECTITLQDLSILLGMRVDGCAITGSTEFKGGCTKIVQDMFGKAPSKQSGDLNGGRLKLSWLSKTFPKLPDDADRDEVIRHTHAFMLQMISGVLFIDHQGSQLHCMFIPLIRNLERSSKLSWGSGVLAFLYRELCKACKIGVEEIVGCVLLVVFC